MQISNSYCNPVNFSGRVKDINELNKEYGRTHQMGFKLDKNETNDMFKEEVKANIKNALANNDELVKKIEKETDLDVGIGPKSVYIQNAHKAQSIVNNIPKVIVEPKEESENAKDKTSKEKKDDKKITTINLNLSEFVKKTLTDILNNKKRYEEMGNPVMSPEFDPSIPPQGLLRTDYDYGRGADRDSWQKTGLVCDRIYGS